MYQELSPARLDELDFSPITNDNVITIMLMEDGNFRGFTKKNGKLVQVRQGDPNTVLQLLLTANVPMTPDENNAPEPVMAPSGTVVEDAASTNEPVPEPEVEDKGEEAVPAEEAEADIETKE
jgi:hypothetical protein